MVYQLQSSTTLLPRKRKIQCRNGHYLEVRPDGTVRGTKNQNSIYSEWKFVFSFVYIACERVRDIWRKKKTKSTSDLFIKKNIAGCGKGFLSRLNAHPLKSSSSRKAPPRKFKIEVREKSPEKNKFYVTRIRTNEVFNYTLNFKQNPEHFRNLVQFDHPSYSCNNLYFPGICDILIGGKLNKGNSIITIIYYFTFSL